MSAAIFCGWSLTHQRISKQTAFKLRITGILRAVFETQIERLQKLCRSYRSDHRGWVDRRGGAERLR